MKFYTEKLYDNYWIKIKNNNLTCIYYNNHSTCFFKNGLYHNPKNAAYISLNGYKDFFLNGSCHSYHNDFTKLSWRKFSKLQTFL